jgi:hypothetical protein
MRIDLELTDEQVSGLHAGLRKLLRSDVNLGTAGTGASLILLERLEGRDTSSGCPACGTVARDPASHASAVWYCRACKAVYSRGISEASSQQIVLPHWSERAVDSDHTRYFDFSDGDFHPGGVATYRRHGWYDPATGRITQTG